MGELVFGDDFFASGPARAEQVVTITVDGPSLASGCAVAGGATSGPAGLLLLLALALLRRRS